MQPKALKSLITQMKENELTALGPWIRHKKFKAKAKAALKPVIYEVSKKNEENDGELLSEE